MLNRHIDIRLIEIRKFLASKDFKLIIDKFLKYIRIKINIFYIVIITII